MKRFTMVNSKVLIKKVTRPEAMIKIRPVLTVEPVYKKHKTIIL